MTEVSEVRRGEEVVLAPKDVTIRGLNPELYNSVAELSRRLGISIGEAINEAMKLFLDVRSGLLTGIGPLVEGVRVAGKSISEGVSNLTPVPVSGVEEIELSKEDFEKFGRRVLITDVRKLTLSQDVDEKTLEKYVAVIRNCEEVYFPKILSKLLALSKCRNVRKISFY
ncbi:MAG: hypothetical protein QXU50_03155 [Candidatus Korarchaeum sp.]